MAGGFKSSQDFSAIVGWELYQVTLDKYHVIFYFNNGWSLLNVAHSFAHTCTAENIDYVYEIYGEKKQLELDRLLRNKVDEVKIIGKDRLDLVFGTGDILSIFDSPEVTSWWFMGGYTEDDWKQNKFGISDVESDLMTEQEIADRNA